MSLIFDCESYRIANAADYLDPIEVPPVTPDRRFTDPVKIAADLATKEAARDADVKAKTQAQLDDCALNPYLARVVALGWSWANEDGVTVRLAKTESAEAELLRDFWAMVADPVTGHVVPLIGFHSRGFDLPLLVVRSMLLGVKAPEINLDRWRSPHPDVMRRLSLDEALRFPKGQGSLRWFAKRLGLPMDDAFSGAEVAQLVESDNWDAIESHCAWDIRTCKAIAQRIGLIKPIRRAA